MHVRRSVLALLVTALWAGPAMSSAQYFGRNRVQYQAFDFAVIRTQHFDIYYYEREREAALDAARLAERAYARLAHVLQHEFQERKPVVLYASHADFQQTNIAGGIIDESTAAFAEATKNRMVLPFTGSYSEFEHVFTHELVHAFQYDILFRRGLFPEANPFAVRLPLWFMEGMAEYLSIGLIDPHTVSWLRDATLNGYLRDLREMSRHDDYLSYRFGQSLWQYVGANWGDEVVGILLQKIPRMGLERAFATTVGRTLPQLSAEWMASVRRKYLPQVSEFTRPEGFAEKLTGHDRLADPWFLSPAISPDGRLMVYLSQRDGFFFDLWLADAHTGKPVQRLIRAARNASYESLRFLTSGATFSPDGQSLAFVAQSGGRDALYVYDLPRRAVIRKLTFELDAIAAPSFSPDGRNIVFSANEGGLSDLFVTDLQGNLTRLTSDRHADLLPSWSPDGTRIAFSTDRGPGTDFDHLTFGNLRIALLELATRNVTVLPDQELGKNLNPVWAPDSRSLIWVNDATTTNNLHLFDLQQNELYRISDLLSGAIAVKDMSPVLSWSQSGRLLFTYFEKAGYNVYAVSDPRALRRWPVQAIVSAEADRVEPSWPSSELPHLVHDSTSAHQPGSAPPGSTRSMTNDQEAAGPVRSYYRSLFGFRPSGGAGSSPGARAPRSLRSLLDSAVLALPDTMDFTHRDYAVRLTPDLIGRPTVGAQAGGRYGSGVYGSSFVALSDMLGNHNVLLAASINGSLSDASFFAGYNFLKRRANVGLAFEQVPLYRYYGSSYMTVDLDETPRNVAASVYLRDVVRSAALTMKYPFSTFQRFELGLRAVHHSSDLLYHGEYTNGEPLDYAHRIDDLSYVQPMAALIFDNALFGWTGPIYGRRYRAQLSRTIGSLAFTEARLDLRNYWNVRQKVVLATRLSGVTRVGGDASRFAVHWGGPYSLRGYRASSFRIDGKECERSRQLGLAESHSSCPVRDQLIGSSAAFINAEVRIPIIRELELGGLGAFPPVDLVTFFDAGLAWDSSLCLRPSARDPGQCETGQSRPVSIAWRRGPAQDPYLVRAPLYSYGAGLRLNVLYTVLRLDYTQPASRPDRRGLTGGVFSISFGPSF